MILEKDKDGPVDSETRSSHNGHHGRHLANKTHNPQTQTLKPPKKYRIKYQLQ